jgi:hypothetical protein
MYLISNNIFAKLILPEFLTRFRHARIVTAHMPMPKTAVNKYNHSVLWQYNVRTPGQIFQMQAKSITQRMQVSSHEHLRLSVFSTDSGHHPRPGFGIYYIRQHRSSDTQ